MIQKDINIKGANILVLGITFKENCPDVRNTKAADVVAALKEYNTNVTIYDPWASIAEVKQEYGLEAVNEIPKNRFDAIVLTVAHNEFIDMNLEVLKKEHSIVYDVKGILKCEVQGKL
jgi:UDP-N-acetyl-D-galactosamine dehydrogenase